MSKDVYNIAIVGLGFGAEFIPIHQAHPNVNLVAVCRRNEEEMNKVADQFDIEKRYTDYDELLKDPEIDAVHINSPIPDHAPQSLKALRAGKANMKDSFAVVERGELFLYNLHIGAYEPANRFNHDPERPRKLLMHRGEIRRLIGRSQQRGLTLVPLKIYFKRGRAKVELAMVRGKRQYDKRRDLANREVQRELEREFKERG